MVVALAVVLAGSAAVASASAPLPVAAYHGGCTYSLGSPYVSASRIAGSGNVSCSAHNLYLQVQILRETTYLGYDWQVVADTGYVYGNGYVSATAYSANCSGTGKRYQVRINYYDGFEYYGWYYSTIRFLSC